MSPREKGRFLRERGWVPTGTSWTGARTWRDPQNPSGSGCITTHEAYKRERARPTR